MEGLNWSICKSEMWANQNNGISSVCAISLKTNHICSSSLCVKWNFANYAEKSSIYLARKLNIRQTLYKLLENKDRPVDCNNELYEKFLKTLDGNNTLGKYKGTIE